MLVKECRSRSAAGSRGAVIMEVLVVGVVLSLISATLLASLLGADRTTRHAGHYLAAAALGESIVEQFRALPTNDDLLCGRREWTPTESLEIPDWVAGIEVTVAQPAGQPENLRRVAVEIRRKGQEEQNPVQVVSYVRAVCMEDES